MVVTCKGWELGVCVMAFVLCYAQPPVVPRDDVLLQLTMSLVQAVLQLKERFKGATTEQYCEFVKVGNTNTLN